MTDILVPNQELEFLLFDWLDLQRGGGIERDTVSAILELARDLATSHFLPHYKAADIEEPRLADGAVKVLPAIGRALQEYARLGLCGLSFPERVGGMGLPHSVATACYAVFASANVATASYVMLTVANARLLLAFANDEQVEAFARPMIDGRWFGTMCLSEPAAGSGLGDIRCKAVPDYDDALGSRYRLRGNKMWISGADQDITENIVHLVLAKIPRADGTLPPGTKGISLFIVPKRLPDGTLNDVTVAGINHKMGYRGTANCLLNFGEGDGAVGWRVGGEGQGLQQMFLMMNEARISVGTGAAAMAMRSHRHSVRYARERVQGKAPGQDDDQPTAIINHPDVRRMLLQQKSFSEGALALCVYCAALADEAGEDAEVLLSLLTPIAKSWPSEFGLVVNDTAIQIHGGYGYTRDFDVEQLWRDNRLNPIHEGTTGIQGIDLLERKIIKAGPRGLLLLEKRLAAIAATALGGQGDRLMELWAETKRTVDGLAGRSLALRLQDSTTFLRAFGHLIIGWMWLELANAAARSLDEDFRAGKLLAAEYFSTFELPQARAWMQTIELGSDLIERTPDTTF